MQEKLLYQYIREIGFLDSCRLLDCGREHCLPDKITSSEEIKKISLHVIMSGKGVICYDGGKETELYAGDLFVLLPGMTYSHYPNKNTPWVYFWIDLEGKRVEETLKMIGINISHPYMKSIKNSRIAEYIENIIFNYESNGYFNFKDVGNFYLIMGELIEKACEKHESLSREEFLIKDALRFIGNNKPDIKVMEIASNLGIHPNYLAMVFKNELGVSPKNYLINRRMKLALNLIEEKDMTIKEVAEKTGYSNQLQFSKAFRKHFGCSPTEYKARIIKD